MVVKDGCPLCRLTNAPPDVAGVLVTTLALGYCMGLRGMDRGAVIAILCGAHGFSFGAVIEICAGGLDDEIERLSGRPVLQ